MDPENIDGRSDIYLLGCVGYWMLTGHPPFDGATPFALIRHHTSTEPVPPSKRTEIEIVPELEAIILRCMEKDPNDRFERACELRAALLPIAERGWSSERSRAWWESHNPLPLGATRSANRGGGHARFAPKSDSLEGIAAERTATMVELTRTDDAL